MRAVWRDPYNGDTPVKVVGFAGEKNGQPYYNVDGVKGSVPGSRLTFPEEPAVDGTQPLPESGLTNGPRRSNLDVQGGADEGEPEGGKHRQTGSKPNGGQGMGSIPNKDAGDILTSDDIISIYRAVGPNEYYKVIDSGKFDTVPTGMEVKQFGLDMQDTINFSERYPDIAAVLEVKIPRSVLNDIGDFTHVDRNIFKNGTVTIQPENLGTFNKYIKEILHVY